MESYIEDGDPESALSVGADMRKINYCFQLFKVKSPCCAWFKGKAIKSSIVNPDVNGRRTLCFC